MLRHKNKQKGIVLLQVLAVIIILLIGVAIFLPLIVKSIEKRETLTTEEKLEIIKEAIVGKDELMGSNLRTSFGFVGDLGILPSTLDDLMVQGSYPSWTVDIVTDVQFGWKGPYLSTQQHNGNYVAFLDTWGNPIQYESGTGSVLKVLRSYGPDNTGGTSDDITLNIEEDEIRGYITGTLKNVVGEPRSVDYIDIYYPKGTDPDLKKLRVYPSPGVYSTETGPCSPSICPVKIPVGIRKIIVTYESPPPKRRDFYLIVNGGPYMNWNLRF